MPTSRTWSLLGALGAAAVVACSSHPAKEGTFREISMTEVEASLGKPGFYVFDANTEDLFAQHHLPGARRVEGKNVAPVLPPDKNARLVFYCTSPS